MTSDLDVLAGRLIAAFDSATQIDPITAADPDFSVAQAYDVLARIEERRRAQGWRPVGRKIGFTNRTIWTRYGVDRPMWAHTWDHTVHQAEDGRATLPLAGFMQPRLEPEVVFHLKAPLGPPLGSRAGDALEVLAAVDWIAAGFEIVQSPFPGWKFQVPDCTAACGLHGALVVGAPLAVTDANRDALAGELPVFEATLSRDGEKIDQGIGANVLDSPALALATLARVLADLPRFPNLAAGEIVTTGTLTDAWPVAAGETWSSDYGALGVEGLTVTFQ